MSAGGFARTPEPPYYAVIFTSTRTAVDEGYGLVAERMVELAAQQPGFLGVESTRGADGLGITVSYWTSLEAIAAWKAQGEHRVAQTAGHKKWYEHFETRIARVERAYSGPKRT
jgi:heme-degrading monooxygenase HmoA